MTSKTNPGGLKPKDVWKKLKRKMKEREPKMVLSVIGYSDSFVPKPWPKSKFQNSLITAVKNAGDTWIFYEGRDYGLCAVVHDALQEYERIEFYKSDGERLLTNEMKETNEKEKKTKKSTPLIHLFGLKPNANAKQTSEDCDNKVNILINYDCSFDEQEHEHVKFLVELEKKLSQKRHSFFPEFTMRIPVLIILLEGDLHAIEHMSEALKAGLPVIVVQGTGKAADLIAECIDCIDIDREIDTIILLRAPVLFGTTFDTNTFELLKDRIKCIVRKRWLINVYNINRDDPVKLSQIVGEAVTRAWAIENVLPGSELSLSLTTSYGTEMFNQAVSAAPIKKWKTVSSAVTRMKQATRNESTASEKVIEQKKSKKDTLSIEVNERQKSKKDTPPPEITAPFSLPLHFYFAFQMINEKPLTECSELSNETLLLEALKENRTDYVQVLLDQGVKFNPKKFPELYATCLIEDFAMTDLKNISNKIGDGPRYKKDETLGKAFCYACQADANRTKSLVGGSESESERDVILVRDSAKYLCAKLLGYKKLVSGLVPSSTAGNKILGPNSSLNQTPEPSVRTTTPCAISGPVSSSTAGNKNLGLNTTPKQDFGNKDKKARADNKDEKASVDNTDEKARADVIEDLLLWAIYANRPDIAKILWVKTENQLCLLCAALLEKLAKEAYDVKENQLSESLRRHSKSFEGLCLMIMDKIYEFDASVSMSIFKNTAVIWGIKSNPSTFAYENLMYDIIAHTCCQKSLNHIWYNRNPPNFLPFLKSIKENPVECIKAPFTKFLVNYFIFAVMLISYSAYVMTSIDDFNYSRTVARLWEYNTYLWALGDLIEELKTGLGIFRGRSISKIGMRFKILHYLNDFWNCLDLLSYTLLIIAIVVRHSKPSDDYTAARRLFSLSLMFMYLRFLQIFFISRRLGPTLIMIKEMVKDLLYFLLIAIVVIIGVGVYYHANLFPSNLALFGPGPYQSWSVWKIFYYPYFQLYGELFMDYLTGEETPTCISNRTIWDQDKSQELCPQADWSVAVVSAVYMLISNLLLVNLVIAMFSYTFDKVQANSEKLWRFQRYTVITDYKTRIPSPLNLLVRPVLLIAMCYRKRKTCGKKGEDNSKENEKLVLHMKAIQEIFAGRCLHDQNPTYM